MSVAMNLYLVRSLTNLTLANSRIVVSRRTRILKNVDNTISAQLCHPLLIYPKTSLAAKSSGKVLNRPLSGTDVPKFPRDSIGSSTRHQAAPGRSSGKER